MFSAAISICAVGVVLIMGFVDILQQLRTIHTQGECIMAAIDDINSKLDEIDTETNEIAADIDTLLANGLTGLTAEQAQAIATRLSAHSESLKAIAAKA